MAALYTKGNRYASATQREAAQALKKLGYEEVGFKKGSHLVMMHKVLGRIEVPIATPPKIVLDAARRKEKWMNSKANRVLDYIHHKYDVKPDEAKVVEGNLARWITEAQEELGGDIARTAPNSLLESIRKGPRLTVIKRALGKGQQPGTYLLQGLLYVAPEEIEAPPPEELTGQGISAVEGEGEAPARPPVIEVEPEPEPVIETNNRPAIKAEDVPAGLDALAAYLNAQNQTANATAKVDLVKDQIDQVYEILRQRAQMTVDLAKMDSKLMQELDTLRSFL